MVSGQGTGNRRAIEAISVVRELKGVATEMYRRRWIAQAYIPIAPNSTPKSRQRSASGWRLWVVTLRRPAILRRDGAYGNRSLLLVVLRDDKEVGNGADECASVLRDRLVAVEHDVEGNVGAVLGPRVVLVL